MNLTIAIALVQQGIRPVRVEYDPDNLKNNSQWKLFKTLDAALAKDDLVIVPTQTRHGFTIAKVVEIDFAIDFHGTDVWNWIGGKFDKSAYDSVLKIEDSVKHKIAKSQENKMRAEMIAAAGIDTASFDEIQRLMAPAPAAPGAFVQPAPIPSPAPRPAVHPARASPLPYQGEPLDDEIPF